MRSHRHPASKGDNVIQTSLNSPIATYPLPGISRRIAASGKRSIQKPNRIDRQGPIGCRSKRHLAKISELTAIRGHMPIRIEVPAYGVARIHLSMKMSTPGKFCIEPRLIKVKRCLSSRCEIEKECCQIEKECCQIEKDDEVMCVLRIWMMREIKEK
jgi:hypothetical protein